MASAASQLEETLDGYFDMAEVPAVAPWAERTVYLPTGETRGFIDFDLTPWAREPINSLTDPDVQTEAGVYGTQMVKTTQAICVALATVALTRQSVRWMWPKVDVARSFSQTRFQPIVNASPALRALKPDNHDLFKNLELHFRHGVVSFVGSHSRIDAKSAPVPVTIVDEIEDIAAATEKETDPISSLKERSKTFTDRKMFLFGSCLLETGPAWKQYLLGDQRHFLLPCPECGTRQALEFRGPVWLINRHTGELELRGRSGDFRLWWDPAARIDEHNWDFEAVRATACYVCPECNTKLRDEHKRPMLQRGVWHPTKRASIDRHRSRRINSLYPLWPSTSFADFAIEFLGSVSSMVKLQNFTNNWEARPWSAGLDTSDKDAVAKRLGYLVGPELRGQRRGDRTLLMVDVQRAHLVWAWFGFDASGAAHLIDVGYAPHFDALRELDDSLKPTFVAVDTRHRAQEVYTACHERRGHWIALRGEAKGAPLVPNYNFDPFTGDRAGRQGMFVITLVHLNTWSWAEEFLNRLYPPKEALVSFPTAQLTAEQEANQVDTQAPRIRDFTVFGDMPRTAPDFVRQLFSTYLVEYIDPKGKSRSRWHESKNDHLFDLCKYAYAIGSMLGFTRIAASARKALEAAAAAAAAAKQSTLPLSEPNGGTKLF